MFFIISIKKTNGCDFMELRNITTFLRVATLASFTKAAEELGYSQSTVTIQIQQLEKELGVALFDRIGKNIFLTPMGEEFISYANELMHVASKALSLGKSPTTYYGTLRIGILESLFTWLFADQIPQYHREFPNVRLDIKTNTGIELTRMLRHNEVDIIFILGDKISQKECIRAFAAPIDVVFVASPENSLAQRTSLTLAEVLEQPFILAERNAIYRRELDRLASHRNIEFSPFLEVNNLVIILKLLKKKMGVSFLPEYVVREDFQKGKLVKLNVKGCDVKLWCQILYHKNKWVTPQMELFIDTVRKSFTNQ